MSHCKRCDSLGCFYHFDMHFQCGCEYFALQNKEATNENIETALQKIFKTWRADFIDTSQLSK